METPSSSLLQLIYLSSASRPISEPDLLEILNASRANNPPLGITGVLIFGDNTFVQVLEGPPEAVSDLYEKISRDPRHNSCRKFTTRATPHRSFPDWSMGFCALSPEHADSLDGYLDLFCTTIPGDPETIAHKFLTSFQRRFMRDVPQPMR